MSLKNFHTPLTEAEVDEIYQLLTPKQRKYMDAFTKRSKKSKWLEVLALKKRDYRDRRYGQRTTGRSSR